MEVQRPRDSGSCLMFRHKFIYNVFSLMRRPS